MIENSFIKDIESKAKEIGFDELAFTSLDKFDFHSNKLKEFIDKNYHGEMNWLKEKLNIRKDPKKIWNEAKSAIVLGINYGPDMALLSQLSQYDKAYISVYSRRKDYHKVIKVKLKLLAGYIQKKKSTKVKVFVDTAPLMEKPLAQAAGLGWTGKHTNLVSKNFGSWLFLGVILTNINFPNKKSNKNYCGTCKECIKICPTEAILKPFVLDARKCISYLTIEHKSHIEKKYRKKIGNRIFGCDDCLAVCPWNKFAKKFSEVKFNFIEKLNMPKLSKLICFDEVKYKDFFQGTPLRRLGYSRFMRNILISVANTNEKKYVRHVKNKLSSESDIIRAMAIWALYCLDKESFYYEKEIRYAHEKSQCVRSEWLEGDSN